MMDELRALLRGCKDAPDDDTPRLILADWLDDHDQPDRAEFVRLSLRLASKEVLPGDEASLLARLHQLYSRHADEWLPRRSDWSANCNFRRGLIEVQCNLHALGLVVEALPPDVLPWLETLVLDYGQQKAITTLLSLDALQHFAALDLSDVRLGAPVLTLLVNSPRLAHVKRLKLAPAEGQKATGIALAQATHLDGLRVLDIHEGMGDGALMALAEAPWFAGLSTLAIRYGSGVKKTIPAWVASPHLPRPRRIDWDFVHPGKKGFAALAESPFFSAVADLRLEQCELGAPEIEALAARADWPHLRRLTLNHNRLDATAMKSLAAMRFPALRVLSLRQNLLDPDGLRELLAAPWMAGVEQLELSNTLLGDDGLRALAASPAVANLRLLSLMMCRVGHEGIRALANSPHLTRLEAFCTWIDSGESTDEILGTLADAPGLPALNALFFSAGITVAGVQRLRASRLAPRLRHLCLKGARFGDEGVSMLASESLAGLTDLSLSFTRFSKQGAAALAAARFPYLVRLDLRGCGLKDDAVRALLRPDAFGSLAMLDLWNHDGSGAHAETLLAWPGIHKLARLSGMYLGNHPPLAKLWRSVAFSMPD